MLYQDVRPMSREEAEAKIESGGVTDICDALLAIAFYEEDWKWAQDKCLAALENRSSNIRALAATCLGHIGRIHRTLEKQRVVNALKGHIHDSAIGGIVQDALDDINMFVPD